MGVVNRILDSMLLPKVLSYLKKVEAECDELKAQVAVMMKALEFAKQWIEFELLDEELPWKYVLTKINQALSPSAGKEMLERMGRLETIEKVVKDIIAGIPWTSKEGRPDYAVVISSDKIARLRAALEGGNEDV